MAPPSALTFSRLMAQTLAAPVHSELQIKKSRFLGCVQPMADRASAQKVVAELRARHPGAAHVCWALLAGGQSAAVDDGEPSGTAGRPMLDVLRPLLISGGLTLPEERLGLLNGRLLGGVIWGVWHWPLMLLVGYEYGTNYLGAPLLGLVVWCVVCFALNTLLDWLYEKTGCIWVPAIAHGAFNAIAALPQVLVTPADAYYNVLGPMPIGLIAALPMLAAAVWLTLREMKQEEKN